MSTLDELHVIESLAKEEEPTTGTAQVTYRFTVCGVERGFAATAVVSGSGAEAALQLIGAVCEDSREWLRAQTLKTPTTIVTKGLFGRRRTRVVAKHIEPSAESVPGSVAATIEIDGVTHAYSAGVSTSGNPYRATIAALASAKTDLWDWAWNQRQNRK